VLMILLLVFAAVFALVALLMTAAARPQTSKQTQAALTSALGPPRSSNQEKMVNVRKEHRLSSIPWLNTLLSKVNLSMDLRRLLAQADLPWTAGKLMLICVAVWLGAGYLIYLRTRSALLGLALGLVAAAAPLLYVLWTRRRRMRKIQQKLPETLDLMVSALRAGHSMGNALGAAAKEAPDPIGRELRLCFEEQNFGANLRTALENLLERVPLQDLRIITTAMLIHKESGGNLAEVLEKTSHVIRDRFRLQQQIKVHTAQGRLTGVVLMSLPLVIGTAIYISNPAYISLLFTRSLGHKMIAGAAVMNFIGIMIIRKIINIAV